MTTELRGRSFEEKLESYREIRGNPRNPRNRQRPKRFSRDEAAELRELGHSWREIAAQLGVPASTIRASLRTISPCPRCMAPRPSNRKYCARCRPAVKRKQWQSFRRSRFMRCAIPAHPLVAVYLELQMIHLEMGGPMSGVPLDLLMRLDQPQCGGMVRP